MMTNKKLFSGIGILLFVVAGAYFAIEAMHQPVQISSSGIWGPEVLNVSYLAEKSDTIQIGKVIEILPSKWNTPDGKRPQILADEIIYTDAVIEVERYLKNPQSKSKIVVRTLGGTVGSDSMAVEDEASFKAGERVFVFLTKDDPFTLGIQPEHYRVVGWIHGKFRIEDGQAVREKLPPEYQQVPLKDLERMAQEG
jgi:hypothetical protein